jgi:hypothetical protein
MIKFSISQTEMQRFRHRMSDFIEEAGRTESEAIQLLAKACAKELAITVPPFGLSAKVGNQYQKSIAKQVNRAIKAGNVKGTPGSAADVHQSFRMANGQVPKGLKTTGKYGRDPVSVRDKETLIDKRQHAAGIAKGAWIAAAERLNGKKISGVGAWVRRHAGKNGSSDIRVERSGTTVMLTNSVSYINKLHRQTYIDRALKRGYMRNFRHMTIIVKKLRGEI